MQTLKNKFAAITIAVFLTFSITASMILIPNASAHSPPWNIPTYAYVVTAPDPVGVGQTTHIYMWLDAVYGAAGGSTAAVGTNGMTASTALLQNTYRFDNYKLTITAPDKTVTTQTYPVVEDPTSSQYTVFTPTQTGTYTLNFTYSGQVYGANGNGYSGSPLINDTYLPSSASITLTVQQAPIPAAITSEPLPTAYWETPIYGENSNWYAISSNWLGSGSPILAGYTSGPFYHPDAIGPLTSHIMWTSQLQFGGVVGGNMYPTGGSDPNGAGYGVSYFEGSSYQPRFVNPLIVDGYLYYTQPVSYTGPSSGPTVCVNLQTGETLWSSNAVPPLSFAYIYNLWDPDQHGTFAPILFTANFARAFDAYTGRALFNVTGVPSGTSVAGPSGEQIRYVMTNQGTTANPNWYMSEWNSSKLWQYDVNPYTGGGSLSPSIVNGSNGLLIPTIPIPLAGETGTLPPGAPSSASNVVPYGSSITVNGNIPLNSNALAPGSTTTHINQINYGSLTTYDWNISIPWHNTMTSTVSVVVADYGDLMLCQLGPLPTGFAGAGVGSPSGPWTMFAVNLNASAGTVGNILWTQTYNPPPGNVTVLFGSTDFQTRTFVVYYQETMQWVGYNLENGNLLWGPTATEVPFDYYQAPGGFIAQVAYGNLYDSCFGGVLYCRSDTTGALKWTYGNGPLGSSNSTNSGLNTFYGVYPTFIQSISNGIVYTATDEHTIPDPLYKGATYQAINATTGKLVWQLSGYISGWDNRGSDWATANGYLTCMNGYNNQIYSIGRGPSATTVKAPDVGVTTAIPITITGTVLDISAGTKQSQQAADFPNGVPCASDASMMAWMGYVYQQQAEPTNFTGVPVTLSVLDSNNNYRIIGTTTTDASGSFGLTWKPDIAGNYTVYATFAGTGSYYGSSAEAHIYAGSPAATSAPTATPLSGIATQATLEYIGIAIIVVVIIIGAILVMLMLRKRP